MRCQPGALFFFCSHPQPTLLNLSPLTLFPFVLFVYMSGLVVCLLVKGVRCVGARLPGLGSQLYHTLLCDIGPFLKQSVLHSHLHNGNNNGAYHRGLL